MSNHMETAAIDITLQPVSGQSIPLYKGEVLRLTQVGASNASTSIASTCYDYKERMSVGHMRLQGFRVNEGHIVVSAPPRYDRCWRSSTWPKPASPTSLGAPFDATAGEREYGLVPRTNCQDTFGEAIREYGIDAG